MSALRALVGLAVVGCALALLVGCAGRPADEAARRARLEPELRRIAEASPDSVVGALVRIEGALDSRRRSRLLRRGFHPEVQVGDVVGGYARAGDLLRVADLPWIRYIELSRSVRVSPPPVVPDGPSSAP
jgi:hypothetical protein